MDTQNEICFLNLHFGIGFGSLFIDNLIINKSRLCFLLSPAKDLDEKTAVPLPSHTVYSSPRFIEQAAQLMQTLKTMM